MSCAAGSDSGGDHDGIDDGGGGDGDDDGGGSSIRCFRFRFRLSGGALCLFFACYIFAFFLKAFRFCSLSGEGGKV